MALSFNEKEAIVAEVAEIASSAFSVVVAEYAGLESVDMDDLRAKSRDGGVRLRVVKNTLARRALEGTDFACLSEALVGPVVMAFSQGDPGAAARVIKDFTKENDKLVIKALSISGQLLDASELDRLAKLPTKDQAISMLMSVMQAPVTKLARTLNEVPGKLVRTVAAIRDDKQAA
ncbi:MAG: 50S ribosomal protein L10 [Gammaproteobacteria bacterium]|nr:MAG: 50S ribosomal protein L10 [Gammaproteobacteria bacterium]